jgi:hypothetical protein
MRARSVATLVALASLYTATSAVQSPVDYAGIDEATELARGSDSARARYHEAYRLFVARAPVDYVELVTPFRRIVIAAQQGLSAGARNFGQRQALDILREAGSLLDVRVEMTFHPQNTFVGVPDYDVTLVGERGRRMRARSLDRLSRWTPRVDGLPPPLPAGGDSGPSLGRPLVGATLVARFDLQSLEPEGTYDLLIAGGASELAKVRLDLRRIR